MKKIGRKDENRRQMKKREDERKKINIESPGVKTGY